MRYCFPSFQNCISGTCFDDSVPFDYSVTGPSIAGDFYAMFNDA